MAKIGNYFKDETKVDKRLNWIRIILDEGLFP